MYWCSRILLEPESKFNTNSTGWAKKLDFLLMNCNFLNC